VHNIQTLRDSSPVRLAEEALLEACRHCYASLFTNRAISYRQEKGFDHLDVALSVGVQKMVRADRASAGVMRVMEQLLAGTSTAKNTARLEQLRVKMDNYWRHRPKPY
jgi:Pyruvate phosphate dikinase, AMP/ATP-binding domain